MAHWHWQIFAKSEQHPQFYVSLVKNKLLDLREMVPIRKLSIAKVPGSFPAVAKQGLPGSLLKLVVYPHERRENEMQRLQRLSTRTLGPGCQTHMACDQLTQDLDAGMQRGCCNLKQKTMAAIEGLKCTSETRFDLMYVVSSLTSIYSNIQHRFWTVLYEYERGAGIHGTANVVPKPTLRTAVPEV